MKPETVVIGEAICDLLDDRCDDLADAHEALMWVMAISLTSLGIDDKTCVDAFKEMLRVSRKVKSRDHH